MYRLECYELGDMKKIFWGRPAYGSASAFGLSTDLIFYQQANGKKLENWCFIVVALISYGWSGNQATCEKHQETKEAREKEKKPAVARISYGWTGNLATCEKPQETKEAKKKEKKPAVTRISYGWTIWDLVTCFPESNGHQAKAKTSTGACKKPRYKPVNN